MERREFLKILGLGGVALTLPKPLGILAAKESDIKAPPLHVGRCEMGPLSDETRTFTLVEMGMSAPMGIDIARYEDYLRSWKVSFFMRSVEDPGSRVKLGQMASHMMPDPNLWMYAHRFPGPKGRLPSPHFFVMPSPMLCDRKTVLEFWWTPGDPFDLPKHPLPKIRISLRGFMHYQNDNEFWRKVSEVRRDGLAAHNPKGFWWTDEADTVQLDRAKAIEMGLVTDAEPEGIIA